MALMTELSGQLAQAESAMQVQATGSPQGRAAAGSAVQAKDGSPAHQPADKVYK